METCLFVEPLLRNSCCRVAYFEVVAWQWVYTPQYYGIHNDFPLPRTVMRGSEEPALYLEHVTVNGLCTGYLHLYGGKK